MRNFCATVCVAIVVCAVFAGAQTWTPVTQPYPGSGAGSAFLLTDGTVMVHQEQDNGDHWYKLTPDINGSYANGTWKQVAGIPFYAPLFFGSAVLPDGRLVVEGGEYDNLQPVWTTKGAIYDPKTDTWTQVNPPAGWGTIGDAQGVILNDGTYMQSNCCAMQWAYLNPSNLSWTQFSGNGKFDVFDEEGFNLLPNGKVLSVDAYVFQFDPNGKNSELYDPTTKMWSSAGATPVQLWDSGCGTGNGASFELGPAVLRPDGTVFATGATNGCGPGHTAIYNTATQTWTAGPDFPSNLSIADGPASIEINGNVLMMAGNFFNPPSTFFEWDGHNLNQIPGPPNGGVDGPFWGHMLALPSGQILFTDYSTDVELFNPSGTYNPAWAPQVVAASNSVVRGSTYTIYGKRLAGMSQGGAYGDDYQPYTNYALVRLTNQATHHVFYCRTHNPSSYAMQSNALQSTKFDVPAGAETGLSILEVVTNGIPSTPFHVTVK